MKLKNVIEKVDRWQPNVFSTQDKLDWCYEVTKDLLNTIPRFLSYTGKVVRDGGKVPLPLGVAFEDCSEIYVNGVRKERLDERTYEDMVLKKGDEVYVVYRSAPVPYSVDENGAVPEALETVCSAPYDSLYIDYVCAQIAAQQNDADEYGKFISMFNTKFREYQMFMGANSPITVRKDWVNWY